MTFPQLDPFYEVREWFAFAQEVVHEGGPAAEEPLIKAVAAVVIKNPFAGRYVEDLSPLTKPSPSLGTALGARARALLGGRPVEGYGKGGIAGVNGEQDHVVACVTTVFGDAFRESVGGGEAWISSATKTASAGASIDIPLAFKDDLYVRSHYDAVTVTFADAPRPDELLICVAVASRGRVHHRVGGLTREEALLKLSAPRLP
ncbi:amino acid synthesis family protein [Leifsonia shinshuensis]|uniref:amino acid synthesis family protein n=1 Tax=Leifsonia shinshuensis TaxID=150026 RepID=UPI001F50DECF|nr:amino acid synthesis family protein [Leifsonia shinshuensis]MCI0156480.1 amino acid synthesis family protein [Leifsonia shinshuensis]